MARAKTSTRRSRSVLEQDRYTAELSSGQLVIGVCILLMFGLGCFLLGVLIGRFDPGRIAPGTAAESTRDAVAAGPATPGSAPGTESRGYAPVRTKPPPPEMRVPLETEGRGPSDSAKSTPPPTQSQAVVEKPPVEGSVPERVEKPPAPEPVSTPANRVSSLPPRSEVAPVLIPTRSHAGSGFGVQVAAFRTRSRAEAAKRDLEARTSYTADLVLNDSGKWVQVVVGSYADKASASRARDDLRDHHGFHDCWVVPKR